MNSSVSLIITDNSTYVLGEIGESFTLKWERLVVDDMPVEDIHLVLRHGLLEKPLQKGNRKRWGNIIPIIVTDVGT